MVSALNIIGNDRSLQEHWLKRVVAIFIDGLIFSAIGWVLTYLLIFPDDLVPTPSPDFFSIRTLLWPAFSGILFFLYSMALEAAPGGATLGKRLLSMRVIALTGDMTVGKAAIRNVSKIYPLFFLIDTIAGFASDGDPKQRWMDRIAGTTVIITTALNEGEQHIYQTQQSKYGPPPQEPYPQTRHEHVYQYPPPAQNAPPPPAASSPVPTDEIKCVSCGGRMAETGMGRLKCIRCGKIQ